MPTGGAPLDLLQPLAVQDVAIAPGLHHLELYSMGGLVTVLWHGERSWSRVLVTCGGAMGSLLGPAGGLFHDLGVSLARDHQIATMRVGYRRPNDFEACALDVAVAVDMAARKGGERFVVMGHSFGGAVAVAVGVALPAPVVGVVTLSTQSAGCEMAGALGERDCSLLLLHGDRDELLPMQASEMVRMIAGTGELVVLPGAGHLLTEAGDELRTRLGEWIPKALGPDA